ncbi:hypothetical protein OGAPHI_002956 [Ogataea philodendri]|uniref:Uncharacterized protein n=1 Tax=Ogataea philodendri TaxID=1378263 RepID=A0A9P8P8I3_9ASCO|nr:uncharacterized protein OGAPHI_002956 [Ogataea philodendri]KAH3667307.1 hypothetical protein OGAPHI_002956 [Ogataea philodendri]
MLFSSSLSSPPVVSLNLAKFSFNFTRLWLLFLDRNLRSPSAVLISASSSLIFILKLIGRGFGCVNFEMLVIDGDFFKVCSSLASAVCETPNVITST